MTFRILLLLALALVQLTGACGSPADNRAAVAQPAMLDLRIGRVRFRPRDIAEVSPTYAENGEPAVLLTFTPSGRRKFDRLQRGRIGQVLEIRVDGELVSSPILRELVVGDRLVIAGNLDVEETVRLADRLSPQPPRR